MDSIWLDAATLLGACLRLATPLLLCALAGLVSERAGVIDIGLEGKMLAGAFCAACVAHWSGSAWAGVAAAVGVGVLLGAAHGFACISQRGDQVVSGMAINIIAAGLTAVLGLQWFGRGGKTPDLLAQARLGSVWPSAAPAVQEWPVIGPLLVEGVLRQSPLTLLALLLVPLLAWVLYATRFGLRLRAVGENPAMVASAGIGVAGLRYQAVLITGGLCGVAGAFLSCAQNAAFSPNMSAGQGFMALAAMIFGKWRPYPALGACLLFGLLDAVAIRLQGVAWPIVGAVPVQLIQALPYALTVVLLAGLFGRSQAPAALGKPW